MQCSILRSIPPQLLVPKQISRKCFSLGRHESLHRGQKYFPVFSRVRLPLKILFLLQKMQHFESAFASICRPDQPCGAGMFSIFSILLFNLLFAAKYKPGGAGELIMRINHDDTSLKSFCHQKAGPLNHGAR